MLPTVRDDGLGLDRGAVARDHDGSAHLTPAGVGDPDDGRLDQIRVIAQDRFDLRWIDVLPARDVHVLRPIDDGVIAVDVARRDIPGP